MFKNSYQQLPTHFYSLNTPQPLLDAQLVHCNHELLKTLGIQLSEETLFKMTKGHSFPKGLTALAQKYTGHQFGYYNPNLGDGRGVLLGQVTDNNNLEWDIHLKGSGQTAYSRQGDGRAVLRSAIREYIIGEALTGLGIATSRCLALCHSPEPVRREQYEDRASYLRIAKTHIRFGHFEWLAQLGNPADFKQLANYAITQVYPELDSLSEPERYAALLTKITTRTASLIAAWQTSGFCHGVMNTDNMSIAGETFDFGPYAFLDDCKIHHVCNQSDAEGRYAYSQQPNIGLWNCQVLTQAFSLILDEQQIENAITAYINTYNQAYLAKMGAKFGLTDPQTTDKQFMADTLILMEQSGLDFHAFFQNLVYFDTEQHALFKSYLPDSKAWLTWAKQYREKLTRNGPEERRIYLIENNTPKLVLRTYILQEIIEAAEHHNYQPLADWVEWIRTPYTLPNIFEQPDYKSYLHPPKAHQKKTGLSCSS